ALMRPALLLDLVRRRAEALATRQDRAATALIRRVERSGDRLQTMAARLVAARGRALAEAGRQVQRGTADLAALAARLEAAQARRTAVLADRLEGLDRMRRSLGYEDTLKRGYAVVRGDGAVVTTRAAAEAAQALEIEFQDGRLTLGGKPAARTRGKEPGPDQGSLF
ncbi:MAG: exodeoxyribonuclease VII large subunit, partial [Sphingomonadales bacterium]|nr:exodeoxyribonuclease VII large subunit [Sphingomonadales bacterium]